MDRAGKIQASRLRLRALVALFLTKAASLFAKARKRLFFDQEHKQNIYRALEKLVWPKQC